MTGWFPAQSNLVLRFFIDLFSLRFDLDVGLTAQDRAVCERCE